MSQVVLFAEMSLFSHSGAKPSWGTNVRFITREKAVMMGAVPSKNREAAVNQVRLVSERSVSEPAGLYAKSEQTDLCRGSCCEIHPHSEQSLVGCRG